MTWYEALPDLTFETFMAWADLLVNVGLLVVAAFALGQLRIAKRAISTRVQREAAKETAVQLEKWASTILEHNRESHELLAKQGVADHNACKMQEFDEQELSRASKDAQDHGRRFRQAMDRDHETYSKLVEVCNEVEASAMHFETGIADESIAFPSLCDTFCTFIETHYPVYCMHRPGDSPVQLYSYSIQLYHRWSQRRAKSKLDAEQSALTKARITADRVGATRPPLGS